MAGMDIRNLEKNILYLMCARIRTEQPDGPTRGTLKKEDILKKFSDIPAENIESAIHAIEEAGWITLNDNQTVMCLTSRGSAEIELLCRPVSGTSRAS